MPKFRLRHEHAVDLFQPAGGQDSMTIESGAIADVPGELAKDQPSDAYLVGEGDDARTWPHALWELVEDKPAKAAPAKENS
jgi:hypothetical protein